MNEIIQQYLRTVGFNWASCSTYLGSSPPDVKGLFCVVVAAINLLLTFAGTVALMFLIYGGFQYIVSGGDEKALMTAKNTITYAILGLFLVLGSIIGLNLVFSIIGLI